MAYVQNFPGFAEPVKGPLLMEQMRQQAQNVGTETTPTAKLDCDDACLLRA